jgi:hypothetical protein
MSFRFLKKLHAGMSFNALDRAFSFYFKVLYFRCRICRKSEVANMLMYDLNDRCSFMMGDSKARKNSTPNLEDEFRQPHEPYDSGLFMGSNESMAWLTRLISR